jgi:large subunit ribosomal protein L11
MLDRNKVVLVKLKIYLNAGEAKATPPLGPLLGQYGVNTVQFCKDFNAATEGFISFFSEEDDVSVKSFELIVEIYIYDDRKFAFRVCKPSTSFLLRILSKVDKGDPKRLQYQITRSNLVKIALFKYPLDRLYSSAMMVRGTARSIGIKVID